MKLRIASYNIWHGGNVNKEGGPVELEHIADFMEKYEIDLCGMQEVDVNCSRTGGVDEPAEVARLLTERTGKPYYSAFAPGLDGWRTPFNPEVNSGYGNCFVSRYPIVEIECLKVHKFPVETVKDQVKEGYEQRSALFIKLDVNGEILTAVTSHFDLKEDARQMMVDMVLEKIQKIDTPLVFMGDFNAGPDAALIRQIASVLSHTGDGRTPFTFPNTEPRAKIDYIFRNDKLKSGEVIVPREVDTSDHLPLFADFETV